MSAKINYKKEYLKLKNNNEILYKEIVAINNKYSNLRLNYFNLKVDIDCLIDEWKCIRQELKEEWRRESVKWDLSFWKKFNDMWVKPYELESFDFYLNRRYPEVAYWLNELIGKN